MARTGGSAFELARDFKEVVAFDFSAAFVRAAQRMQMVRRLPAPRAARSKIFATPRGVTKALARARGSQDGSAPYRATVEADISVERVAQVRRARPSGGARRGTAPQSHCENQEKVEESGGEWRRVA